MFRVPIWIDCKLVVYMYVLFCDSSQSQILASDQINLEDRQIIG